MFSPDADLFFLSPCTRVDPPNWFGVLYLLRRDIDYCMGIDPNTGKYLSNPQEPAAAWPGAMGIMAGVDLLAKFLAGSDKGGVGRRFCNFLDRYFDTCISSADRCVLYQLRNSLLHSFSLYSKDRAGKEYRFFLRSAGTAAVISHNQQQPERYYVDLRALHSEFEKAVAAYGAQLDSDLRLQAHFSAMFVNYGRIHIG
jgi:hypothetical protein